MEKNVWICIQNAGNNYAAYAPEVLGCIATRKTIEETRAAMIGALASHLEGMLEDGESLDNITGKFPIESLTDSEGDDYWTVVKIDIVVPEITVGAGKL